MDSKWGDRGREAERPRPPFVRRQAQLFAVEANGVEVVSHACGAKRSHDRKQARAVGDL